MARKQDDQFQFVDISEKAAKPKVVREGFHVPPVNLDQKKADFFVDQLVTVTPKQLPRVISQSVPPGTKVTRGTVIDLVLAPKDAVPFDIFENAHADLKTRALTHVDDIVENPAARQILLSREKADDVPPAEKQTLITEFGKKGIRIDEADPDRTFNKAFDSVRGAVAFR